MKIRKIILSFMLFSLVSGPAAIYAMDDKQDSASTCTPRNITARSQAPLLIRILPHFTIPSIRIPSVSVSPTGMYNKITNNPKTSMAITVIAGYYLGKKCINYYKKIKASRAQELLRYLRSRGSNEGAALNKAQFFKRYFWLMSDSTLNDLIKAFYAKKRHEYHCLCSWVNRYFGSCDCNTLSSETLLAKIKNHLKNIHGCILR